VVANQLSLAVGSGNSYALLLKFGCYAEPKICGGIREWIESAFCPLINKIRIQHFYPLHRPVHYISQFGCKNKCGPLG
jgi:hypothetical protein